MSLAARLRVSCDSFQSLTGRAPHPRLPRHGFQKNEKEFPMRCHITLDYRRCYKAESLKAPAKLTTGACCASSPLALAPRELLTDVYSGVVRSLFDCAAPFPLVRGARTGIGVGN